MFRSILVPLDGSAAGEHALPYALALARRGAGVVQLVHVCAPLRTAAGIDRTVAEVEEQHARARTYLAELGGALAERWQVPVNCLVLDGPPAATLNAYATTGSIDMVVMATHGRGAVSRLWLGSVADTLVRHCGVPVLLARPHGEPVDVLEAVHDKPFQRVLITLDGSELAEEALGPALSLSATMGAAVTLLKVVDLPPVGYSPAAAAAGLQGRLLDQLRADAALYLRGVADQAARRVEQVNTRVLVGHPASAILEYARQHAVDLIALATHGAGGVRRMLLGSVADKVARGATVPVLITRPVSA